MPRRSILSAVEKEGLIAIPIDKEGLIERYTLCEKDISWVNQRRGDQNRLGMAIQICLLRYPGQGLLPNSPTQVPNELVTWVAKQLNINPDQWDGYALRSETRREHLLALRAYLKIAAFGISERRQLVEPLSI